MDTWVMREMGRAWNAETHCPYTGLALWTHARLCGDVWRVFYYREDGTTMRCRDASPDEVLWIANNPQTFARLDHAFAEWLDHGSRV